MRGIHQAPYGGRKMNTMVSEYDFIIENIRFSYSSVNTFDTCAYSFKMTYIDKMPRANNFFGEYGTFVHECMEKYFLDELEPFELSAYYRNNYNERVVTSAPPYPVGMADRYFNEGAEFFDSFSFDKENYEIVQVEGTLDFALPVTDGIFTGRPDLVMRNRETGKLGLFDFKTSRPFWNDKFSGALKTDKKKMEGYHTQMFVYTYGLRKQYGMNIDEITLWFTRPSRLVTIPWDSAKEKEAIDHIESVIKRIKNENEFPYNNKSKYFCDNLCSVRQFCEYR